MPLQQPRATSTRSDRRTIKMTMKMTEAFLRRLGNDDASSPKTGPSFSAIIQYLKRHTSRVDTPCTKKFIKPVLNQFMDCYRKHELLMFVNGE
jgi:hypothetical protein